MASFTLLTLCLLSFISLPQGYLAVDTHYFPSLIYFINLITYQFAHANRAHILGNIFFGFPWVFYLENVLGERARKVFNVYLWGGVSSALLQTAVKGGGLVGASGSLAACAGYAAFKQGKISQLRIFLMCMVVGDVLNNAFAAKVGRGHIAYWGHLGGYAYGIASALLPQVLQAARQYSLRSRKPQHCDQSSEPKSS